MKKNTRWIGLYTAMLCVAGLGPAQADITAVLPVDGGTVGTVMTLMGSGFGDRRGNVWLGKKVCQVRSWADTIITCEVLSPQPAGDYTVKLLPHGSKENAKPMTSTFTMRGPQITPGNSLQLVTPGERVTVAGAFFGDQKGEVYLRDTPGETVAAKVRQWSMESISFEIPKGLAGCLALEVANAVGLDIQPSWGTLTPVPPAPPGATAVRNIYVTLANNNASGVYFNNALWVFYAEPHTVISPDDIQVLCFTNGVLKDAPGIGGSASAQVVPMVIAHQLWAFQTGENGGLYYKRFLTVSNMWENGAKSWNRIGTLTTDSGLEIAPVYNPIQDRIEVYYNYKGAMYWTVSPDRGTTWSVGKPVGGLASILSAPSAIFYQQTATNGVTLLAVGVNDASGKKCPAVFWVQNGAVVKSHLFSPGLSGRPFLADLGEDYLAMTWITANGANPQVQKANKKTGQWLTPYTLLAQAANVSPNMAVNYEPQVDPTRSVSNLWNANLYLFWGYNASIVNSTKQAVMSNVERLGYWQETAELPKTTNLGSDPTNCFQFWSVIGVIDAPPFILNGQTNISDDGTCLTLSSSTEHTASSEMSFTVGPYVETGEKSPMKLELSASVGETIGNEHKTTVSFQYPLNASLDGEVRVYYLAPELEVHRVQWHNLADPNETNDFMYPTLFTGNTSVRSLSFNPTNCPYQAAAGMRASYFQTNFPLHQVANDDRQRLESYVAPPNPCWFSTSLDWNSGAGNPSHISFVEADQTNSTQSASLEFKIGANIMGYIGFGIEGSFEVQTATSTTITTGCELVLDNPSPTNPPLNSDPIDHFALYVKWLEPDAAGYWVPWNRQGSGDQPWFVTYGLVPNSIYKNP